MEMTGTFGKGEIPPHPSEMLRSSFRCEIRNDSLQHDNKWIHPHPAFSPRGRRKKKERTGLPLHPGITIYERMKK
jgi:hypothetical protein